MTPKYYAKNPNPVTEAHVGELVELIYWVGDFNLKGPFRLVSVSGFMAVCETLEPGQPFTTNSNNLMLSEVNREQLVNSNFDS